MENQCLGLKCNEFYFGDKFYIKSVPYFIAFIFFGGKEILGGKK